MSPRDLATIAHAVDAAAASTHVTVRVRTVVACDNCGCQLEIRREGRVDGVSYVDVEQLRLDVSV